MPYRRISTKAGIELRSSPATLAFYMSGKDRKKCVSDGGMGDMPLRHHWATGTMTPLDTWDFLVLTISTFGLYPLMDAPFCSSTDHVWDAERAILKTVLETGGFQVTDMSNQYTSSSAALSSAKKQNTLFLDARLVIIEHYPVESNQWARMSGNVTYYGYNESKIPMVGFNAILYSISDGTVKHLLDYKDTQAAAMITLNGKGQVQSCDALIKSIMNGLEIEIEDIRKNPR